VHPLRPLISLLTWSVGGIRKKWVDQECYFLVIRRREASAGTYIKRGAPLCRGRREPRENSLWHNAANVIPENQRKNSEENSGRKGTGRWETELRKPS